MRTISFVVIISFAFGCSLEPAAQQDSDFIERLDKKVADNTFKQINGVVVMKDGELILERYYNGTEAADLHNPRSVGKTFASAMVGIALRDGYLESVDQTLDEFYDLSKYDNADPRKGKVTLKQLLTMTSGFEGFDFDTQSIGNEENMYPTDNWVVWTLNLPMARDRDPGDAWFYFTAGAVVLGDILNQVLPGGLEAYAQTELFEPLGITELRWQYTPQGVANTAGGLQLSTRDFAKFGQLYENGGKWGDKQILPADFVAESFKNHASTTEPNNNYGYLWWKTSYTVDGKQYKTSYASGNGGNKIYVFESIPVVVAITASAYGRPYGHRQVDEIMQAFILPWVLNTD